MTSAYPNLVYVLLKSTRRAETSEYYYSSSTVPVTVAQIRVKPVFTVPSAVSFT